MELRPGTPLLVVLGVVVAACTGAAARPGPEAWGAAGSSFRDCADCPEMVVVPSGSFLMGSPAAEAGRFEEEGPQHTVTLARTFALSAAPITRAEYERFARSTARAEPDSCTSMGADGNWVATPGLSWRSPGYEQSGEHPVVCVSWHDAEAYAVWLAGRTGQRYRLPTESEAEYAARAGASSTFPWGESAAEICAHANSFDAAGRRLHPDWGGAECDDGHAYTAPVRAFPANAFGLYGTTGNVFQWTADCWVEGGYAGAPADGAARSTGECVARVIRGGSWLNSARGLRAAMRDRDPPAGRYTNIGIRVAREP